MGMDMEARRSVMTTVKEMAGLINAGNMHDVVEAVSIFESVYAKELAAAKPVSLGDYYSGGHEDWMVKERFIKPIKTLNRVTVKDIRKILTEAMPIPEDDLEQFIEHDGFGMLVSLWSCILERIAPNFPELSSLIYFNYIGSCGTEVPLNTAVFIFEAEDCFERRPSPAGEVLRKALKRPVLDEIRWVAVNY
jgi:hypothetical protein